MKRRLEAKNYFYAVLTAQATIENLLLGGHFSATREEAREIKRQLDYYSAREDCPHMIVKYDLDFDGTIVR